MKLIRPFFALLLTPCCAPAAPATAPAAPELPTVPPLALSVPAAQSVVLGNGLNLVLRPDRIAPRVAFSLLVKAGAADENSNVAGWRRLLSGAMLRGSLDAAGKAVDSRDVRLAAEKLDAITGATVGDDYIEFWAVGDSAHQGELLDLLLQLVRRPRLAEGDVEAALFPMMKRIDDMSNDVPAQAIGSLRQMLYRDVHDRMTAYALPENGSGDSLRALTVTRLRALHSAFFQPAGMTFAAAGDLDAGLLRTRLESLKKEAADDDAGTLPRPGNVPKLVPPSKDNPPLVVRQLPMRGAEPAAWLFVGFSGPGAASADLPALRVMTVALGEMPRNRLEKRLLSQRMIPGFEEGGAQQATAQWTPRSHAGELVLFAQMRPDHIEEVKNALLDEVRKLREAPLTAPELERARNFAAGGWAVDRENLRDRAFHGAFAPTVGAGADTRWPQLVATVTAAQVQKAAAKYLQNYAVTLIMPEE